MEAVFLSNVFLHVHARVFFRNARRTFSAETKSPRKSEICAGLEFTRVDVSL
jgi:hypothetical protein